MAPKIRQNFHTTSEAAINKQINMELYASYVYMSMVREMQLQVRNLDRIHFPDLPESGVRNHFRVIVSQPSFIMLTSRVARALRSVSL